MTSPFFTAIATEEPFYFMYLLFRSSHFSFMVTFGKQVSVNVKPIYCFFLVFLDFFLSFGNYWS